MATAGPARPAERQGEAEAGAARGARRFDSQRGQLGRPMGRVGVESLHDLRHACGSYLIAEGVDPRTVMEVLGHSTFRLTMDTYAHVLDGQLTNAADAMDRALARP